MWIITEKGFVSAVAYNEAKDAGPKMSRNKRRRLGKHPILARARVKDDLEQLREFFPKLEITDMKSADYQFRAFVPRKAFMEWAMTYAGRIDYDSHFKEVAASRSPKADGRHSAMMAVWTAMSKLQPAKPWSGKSGSWGNLCDAREYGTSGKWCNYTTGHAGRHSFEPVSDNGGGKQLTLPTQPKPLYAENGQKAGCAHRKHEFRDGKWMGNYGTDTGLWYPCSAYGDDERNETPAALRDPEVASRDTVIGLMMALTEAPVEEVKIDDQTPNVCWELWAYCDMAFGSQAQLSEDEVAQAVVDCSEDAALVQYHDEFLEALDEFGWTVTEAEDGDRIAEPVENDPETAEGGTGETAVAVEGGVS